jgi:1-deoxy-D-xylulose-5-phosphate synthase
VLPVLQLGLPDEFIEHGDPGKLLAQVGLDATGIERSIRGAYAALLDVDTEPMSRPT